MASNAGKTIAALLIGAAAGTVAGYFLGTDKEKREEHLKQIKGKLDDLQDATRRNYEQMRDKVKDRFSKHKPSLQEEIYSTEEDH